jgi:hypothetical protein
MSTEQTPGERPVIECPLRACVTMRVALARL